MAEARAAPSLEDAPSNFNLQVVSPSASVNRPLSFPSIPPSTTVRQLKEKIRNALEARPADDQQRLIHRGRLLARDDETLEHILGTEALRSGDQQTLHLVLRDLSEHHHVASHGTPVRGQSPAPATLPQRLSEAQQRAQPQQHPRPHPHIHPHAQHHIHGAHAYPPGNRPLTAPILHMPPGVIPIPFQPNGPFLPPAIPGAPNHEQIVNQAHQIIGQMMNQNQQRAATPVGSSRASPHPPANAQDPANVAHLGAQLALQLALNAQQQENLANQAEQITLHLSNQALNRPNRATPATFLPQGQVLLHQGNHLLGEAQQLLDRSQRERAAAGLHGIQDNGQARQASGRNSPAIGQPVNVTREMVGPNGQYIRMTTSVGGHLVAGHSGQSGSAASGRGPLLSNEIQNILRGAEASQATQAMTNAMHRSASGASLANMANVNAPIQPIAPGVTTSIFQNASRHGSRTATPDPSQRTPSHGSSSIAAFAQPAVQTHTAQAQPEVYILSSSTGPHALLITNQETYYTPPPVIPQHVPSFAHSAPGVNSSQVHNSAQVQQTRPQGELQLQNPIRARRRQRAQPRRPDANNNNQVDPAFNVHQRLRPPNAGAAAVLAAVWPHIWLIVRLAAFVWWFTATDSSWSRWITVVLIAIGVFAVNTGLLNGVAHQAWDPFRRHLDGLLPLGDPPHDPNAAPPAAGQQGQQQAGGGGAAGGNNQPNPAAPAAEGQRQATQQPRQEMPDPAEAAARLVAQRRNNNANWLMDQIRRIERAGLLFLASIAPGVAERHIAHLEAQERAAAQERARREAEERQAQEAPPAVDGVQRDGEVQGQEESHVHGQAPEQEPADGQRHEGPLIPT